MHVFFLYSKHVLPVYSMESQFYHYYNQPEKFIYSFFSQNNMVTFKNCCLVTLIRAGPGKNSWSGINQYRQKTSIPNVLTRRSCCCFHFYLMKYLRKKLLKEHIDECFWINSSRWIKMKKFAFFEKVTYRVIQ